MLQDQLTKKIKLVCNLRVVFKYLAMNSMQHEKVLVKHIKN